MSVRIRRIACLVAFLAVVAAAYAPVAAFGAAMSTGYGGWFWRYPQPQGNSIRAVAAVGSLRAWAVGEAGTILKTTNGGKSWKRQSSHVMKRLNDVDFVDSGHGWAVGGENGSGGAVVLRTSNGGTTWKKVATLPLPSNVSITKVDFVDHAVGWIGCTGGKVYKSTNGGKTWHALSVPLTAEVTSLKFVSRKTGWVCGRGDFEVGGKILKTTNGGKTWQAYPWHPELGDDGECVTAMTFASSQTGWFVTSEARVFKTKDRGKHWTGKYVGSGYKYTDVNFHSTKVGWIATSDTVLRTTNGGSTWKKPTRPVQKAVGVAHLTSTRVVALGGAGYTYRSSTGGKTWVRKGSGLGSDFVGVSLGDASHGWAIGEGLILRTSNGGTSWSRQTVPSGILGPMAVSAPSALVAWTCGYGDIMRTTNGGSAWTQVRDGAPWTYAISGHDALRAISVGEDGHVLWTANGGASWNDVATGAGSLRAVDMVSSSVAYVLGDDGLILRTGNGGATWTPRSVSSAYTLRAVDFISADVGWVAGVRDGRPAILHTINGGLSWQVQPTGTAPGGLSSIGFLDSNRGLAAGDVGGFGITMSTTDGGATWTRTYSGTNTLLGCAYKDAGRQVVVGENAILSRVP